jgi:hypothetical protein
MVCFEQQLSNFLSPFVNIESSDDSIASFNMKPSRSKPMVLTEIMDKPTETGEILKIIGFVSEFLECHLTKCGAIGKSSRCNEIAQHSPGQFSFFLFGECSMVGSMHTLKPWSPTRVLRPYGFPVVKSRLWELVNLTHS